jgi:diguanylate cyclase (GGDEF)-like protein/PAS domain S-box-containing protein
MSPVARSEASWEQRGSVAARMATYRRQILRMLIADANLEEVERCLQELKRAQFAVSADVVHTSREFAERLRSKPYDVILADCAMPNWTGMQALELSQQHAQMIPFILVTHVLEEKILDEFISRGASDWVGKNQLARLPAAVALAVEEKILREERNRAEKALQRSEARYRALVENATSGICRFDVHGKFLEVNQTLVEILGYQSRDDLIAANLANDIIRDPVERAQLFEPNRQKGRIDGIELDWKRKDGTPVKVRLSGRKVCDEQGGMDSGEIIAEVVMIQRVSDDPLRHLIATDALTGLANYWRFAEALESEKNRSDRTGRAFAVVLFDLDGMRQINDRCGHPAGNRALCRVADILRFACRSMDTPARYGGDEFAIVLPETGAAAATLVARRICERLEREGEEPALSVSVGFAMYPEEADAIGTLLYAAQGAPLAMKGKQPRAARAGLSSIHDACDLQRESNG